MNTPAPKTNSKNYETNTNSKLPFKKSILNGPPLNGDSPKDVVTKENLIWNVHVANLKKKPAYLLMITKFLTLNPVAMV